jgi:hypothetical protein
MRKLIGVIVGIVVAALLVDTSWAAADTWFPAPISADASDADLLAGFVMKMPLAGQLVLTIGWFVTGLVSAFAALRVAQWRPAGWIAVVFVIATGVWNLTQLAQPLWLQAATLVLPLAGAWLAERHYHRARPGDPLIN